MIATWRGHSCLRVRAVFEPRDRERRTGKPGEPTGQETCATDKRFDRNRIMSLSIALVNGSIGHADGC